MRRLEQASQGSPGGQGVHAAKNRHQSLACPPHPKWVGYTRVQCLLRGVEEQSPLCGPSGGRVRLGDLAESCGWQLVGACQARLLSKQVGCLSTQALGMLVSCTVVARRGQSVPA